MADIFISYSREDADFVRRLAADFSSAGHETPFFQQAEPAPERWEEARRTKIASADVFLFVYSGGSSATEFHLQNLGYAKEYARRRGRPVIVPILLGDVSPPAGLEGMKFHKVPDPNSAIATQIVSNSIESAIGRAAADRQERQADRDRIERTSAEYVSESLDELRSREKRLRQTATLVPSLTLLTCFRGFHRGRPARDFPG